MTVGSDVIWTIVGVLAVIALLVFILRGTR
jgi:uncharacterized membrane protein